MKKKEIKEKEKKKEKTSVENVSIDKNKLKTMTLQKSGFVKFKNGFCSSKTNR